MSGGRQEYKYRGGDGQGGYPENSALPKTALRWKRSILLAFLFFIFVFVIITGVLSMTYAGEVIHPPQSKAPPINRNIAHRYVSVSFKSGDGAIQLYGWHFNAKKTADALIIVHGFGGNRFPFGEQTLDLIEAVIAADFNVLAFDFRNSGGSGSGISTFGLHEMNDVLGAIDFMRNAGYTNIAVLGVSTGAGAAALAGANSPMEDVGALILDSPIVDTGSFIMHLLRAKRPGLPEFPFDIIVPALTGVYINGVVADADVGPNLDGFIPRHVQLIYGSNDEIVSMDEIMGLYNGYMSRAVGKISIWNVPGAGHGECYAAARDEYIERVVTFLRRVFA